MPLAARTVCNLLRRLIDGLVTREPGLLAEGDYRLDQLVDLCIEEVLPVAGLEIFNLDWPSTEYRSKSQGAR